MTYLREHLQRGGMLFVYALLWLVLTPVVLCLCCKKAPLQ